MTRLLDSSLALGGIKTVKFSYKEGLTFEQFNENLKQSLGDASDEFLKNLLYTCVREDLLRIDNDLIFLTEEGFLTVKFLQSIQNAKGKKTRLN